MSGRNMQMTPQQAPSQIHSVAAHEELAPIHDLVEYLREYAREKPEAAALWCFGIGFVLGWKLKPW